MTDNALLTHFQADCHHEINTHIYQEHLYQSNLSIDLVLFVKLVIVPSVIFAIPSKFNLFDDCVV